MGKCAWKEFGDGLQRAVARGQWVRVGRSRGVVGKAEKERTRQAPPPEGQQAGRRGGGRARAAHSYLALLRRHSPAPPSRSTSATQAPPRTADLQQGRGKDSRLFLAQGLRTRSHCGSVIRPRNIRPTCAASPRLGTPQDSRAPHASGVTPCRWRESK